MSPEVFAISSIGWGIDIAFHDLTVIAVAHLKKMLYNAIEKKKKFLSIIIMKNYIYV